MKTQTIAFLIFLLGSLSLSAQKSESQTSEKYYPYNTQVGISLNVNLVSGVKFEPHSDYIRSYPSIGAGLGVYLYQRVYKWFGIQIGAEYNHVTVCHSGTENFTKLFKKIVMTYCSEMFNFPILFNASYYFNEKHGLDISLGGAPLIMTQALDNPPSNSFNIIEGEYNENGDYYGFMLGDYPRFNFSLYGKIGYNFLFKKKNTFGVAIIGSYAVRSYAQGRYFVRINDGTRVESGNASLRNIFIGLQFSYGFTMKKLLCIPVKE
jgi:hypothetical protein